MARSKVLSEKQKGVVQTLHTELLAWYRRHVLDTPDDRRLRWRTQAEVEYVLHKLHRLTTADSTEADPRIGAYIRNVVANRTDVEHRNSLWHAGDVAERLWTAIDEGCFSPRVGFVILQQAKQRKQNADHAFPVQLTADDVNTELDRYLSENADKIPAPIPPTIDEIAERQWGVFRRQIVDALDLGIAPSERSCRVQPKTTGEAPALNPQSLLVWDYLRESGPRTQSEAEEELQQIHNSKNEYHTDFSPLEKLGYLKRTRKRKCTVTGRVVQEWTAIVPAARMPAATVSNIKITLETHTALVTAAVELQKLLNISHDALPMGTLRIKIEQLVMGLCDLTGQGGKR